MKQWVFTQFSIKKEAQPTILILYNYSPNQNLVEKTLVYDLTPLVFVTSMS